MSKFELPRKEFFKNLTAGGAVSILKKRGHLDDHVTLNGVATTPGGILKHKESSALATNIGPVAFFGGPPNNLKWFTGSILTYILDKVYFSRSQKH